MDCINKLSCLTQVPNHIDLIEEKQWIDEAKKDPSAFKPLYLKYYDEIYRYIFRRTGRELQSAEICSETFYKALANLKKYTWRNIPFGNWLYTIAANEIKKRYRNKRELFIVEIDKIQEEIPVEEVVDRAGPDKLVWALGQLSDMELHMVELKYFEHKTFKEVGLLLNMSESAIKMRIYRLLLAMKELIEKRDDQI